MPSEMCSTHYPTSASLPATWKPKSVLLNRSPEARMAQSCKQSAKRTMVPRCVEHNFFKKNTAGNDNLVLEAIFDDTRASWMHGPRHQSSCTKCQGGRAGCCWQAHQPTSAACCRFPMGHKLLKCDSRVNERGIARDCKPQGARSGSDKGSGLFTRLCL